MRVDPVFVRGHQRCAEPLAIFYFQTSYRLFVKKDKAARGIFDLSEFERSGCALLFSLGFFLRVIHRGAHSKNRVVVLRKPNSTSTTTQHTKPQTPKRKRPQLCSVASWSHLTQTSSIQLCTSLQTHHQHRRKIYPTYLFCCSIFWSDSDKSHSSCAISKTRPKTKEKTMPTKNMWSLGLAVLVATMSSTSTVTEGFTIVPPASRVLTSTTTTRLHFFEQKPGESDVEFIARITSPGAVEAAAAGLSASRNGTIAEGINHDDDDEATPNKKKNGGYQRIEEWNDQQNDRGSMTYEQRLQFDGQRYGNQLNQDSILRRELGRW